MSDTTVTEKSLPYRNKYRETLDEPVIDPNAPTATATDQANQTVPVNDAPVNPLEAEWKTRYDNLKRAYDPNINREREKVRQLEVKIAELQRQMETAAALPVTKDAIDKWKQEFPDVYNVMRGVIAEETNKDREFFDAKIKAMEEQTTRAQMEKALLQLRNEHPDFDELNASQEFHDWVKLQPKQIMEWVYSNQTDAALCSKAINLYKAERGITTKKPAATGPKPSAAALVTVTPSRADPASTSTKKVWTWEQIRKMPTSVYLQYEAEIDAAHARGEIQ